MKAPDLVIVDGVSGGLNITDEYRLNNIRSSIRLGLPQVWPHGENGTRVCLVGGGPSLGKTVGELRSQAWQGHKVVAMNGSYEWLQQQNLWPSAMVMIDGRAFNARFLAGGAVPKSPNGDCKLFLASQCAPEVFEAAREWPEVFIFHAVNGDETEILDSYYLKAWRPVTGGSTVMLRSLCLFHMLGFRWFDLYGCDSCFDGDAHHAYTQNENDGDELVHVECAGRQFVATPWQISQAIELRNFIKENGDALTLRIHGDGLLAHLLSVGAEAWDELQAQQKG